MTAPPKPNCHNIAEHFTQCLCSCPGHFLSSACQRQNISGFYTFRNCFPFCILLKESLKIFIPSFLLLKSFHISTGTTMATAVLFFTVLTPLPDILSHKTAILFFHILWAPCSNVHHRYRHFHVSLAVCSNNPPTFLVPPY